MAHSSFALRDNSSIAQYSGLSRESNALNLLVQSSLRRICNNAPTFTDVIFRPGRSKSRSLVASLLVMTAHLNRGEIRRNASAAKYALRLRGRAATLCKRAKAPDAHDLRAKSGRRRAQNDNVSHVLFVYQY